MKSISCFQISLFSFRACAAVFSLFFHISSRGYVDWICNTAYYLMHGSRLETTRLCFSGKVMSFIGFFFADCQLLGWPLWQVCFVFEGDGSVSEVTYGWSLRIRDPWECPPKINIPLFPRFAFCFFFKSSVYLKCSCTALTSLIVLFPMS